MEDAHICGGVIVSDVPDALLFAVFDGHGGKEVSIFCARYQILQESAHIVSMAVARGGCGRLHLTWPVRSQARTGTVSGATRNLGACQGAD